MKRSTLYIALALLVVFIAYLQLLIDQHAKMPSLNELQDPKASMKTAAFGGGCFWSTEKDFEQLPGVIMVTSGYMGGKGEHPTYDDYADRGFREVVLVTYDANKLSYGDLVEYLIRHIDPTDDGGTFVDRGQEYVPAIYYDNPDEARVAEEVITTVDMMKVYDKPLTIKAYPSDVFWPAEDYHQDYYKKNPVHYELYRAGSGRDIFTAKHWVKMPFPSVAWGKTNPMSTSTLSAKAAPAVSTTKSVPLPAQNAWDHFVRPPLADLKKILPPLSYNVTQENGTERAFNNPYYDQHDEGIYVDIVSGEPLFSSRDKYDSGTGWPSFVKPLSKDAVIEVRENDIWGERVEIRSKIADSHLGHVFADGPRDRGGLRYCMNSAALRFIPKAEMQSQGYSEFLSDL